MKTSLLFAALFAGALLATPTLAATDAASSWYAELAAVQQASPQNAGGRARAAAILHAALLAARDGFAPGEATPAGASREAAAAQAAYAVMAILYPESMPALEARLAQSLAEVIDDVTAIAAGRQWGEHVAQVVLAGQGDAVSLNPYTFVEAVKAPVAPSPVPEMNAGQAAIGAGRYRFRVLAGEPGVAGSADGIGAAARFDHPAAIAVDAAGNSYVSERDLCTIRKITPDGAVTTLAGAAGQKGSEDGTGAAARFNGPLGLAVDGAGNVYVADAGNHTIRRIDPSGAVTTLAGSAGMIGRVDGRKAAARFAYPTCLTVNDAGVVFVGENNTDVIRRITPDGTVSTLGVVLPAYYAVYASGVPVHGVCVDHAGNLYAIYSNFFDIYDVLKLTPVAGGHYESSLVTPPALSFWGNPLCLAIDDADNLYVKYATDPIYRFAPGGGAEALYSSGNSGGYAWNGLAVDKRGTLFALASLGGYPEKMPVISIGTFDPAAGGLAITYQPLDATVEVGPTQAAFVTFEVQVAGTSAPTYQWFFNAQPIAGATTDTYTIKNVQNRDAGLYAVVVTDGTGSLTSRTARLAVKEAPPSPPLETKVLGGGSTSPGPGSADAGAGSFDAGLALALLGLLAAAARCGGRTFNIAAVGTHGMKEPK